MIEFRVESTCGNARAGTLTTSHGEVKTPAFQPVGTQATVKSLSADEVAGTGARLVIMNTYHLWQRPGPELVAERGGLHEFSRWPHSITTDSGGFQAFSLAERTRVDEDGFEFSSHLDGRRLRLSPEEAMRIQGLLGSDIAMQLDVCAPAGAARAELELAVARTTRWAERCLRAKSQPQALFGIIQGGLDVELRLEHAERTVAHVATGAPGDLGELGRLEGPPVVSVELRELREGDVIEVEVQPHADRIGGDEVLHFARLVHRDLRVAGAGAQGAEDDRGAAALRAQALRQLVDLRHAERDDGAARRKGGE